MNVVFLLVLSVLLFPKLAFSASENTQIFTPLIILSSSNSDDKQDPASLTTHIKSENSLQMLGNLSDLIKTSPSVASNGQGGHFQNFSIRGVSKHRIKTLVSGIRIESDRRAGASASFIDPLLISEAAVYRNPASTLFGSGALGGAVQVKTRHFTQPSLMTGYSSEGSEHYQVFGTGQDSWSFGAARREASNATATGGDELNSHFSQYSVTFVANGHWQGLDLDFLILPSFAKDIGKSNTSFPAKTTLYPEEKHLLMKLGVDSDSGWNGNFYIHPNGLETEVHTESKNINRISGEAFDLGSHWQFEHDTNSYNSLIGLDYFGRRRINIKETGLNLVTREQTFTQSLNNGQENELALYGTLDWTWHAVAMKTGARVSYFDQKTDTSHTQTDTAWSSFINLSYLINNELEFTADMATSYRFPTLSERFFSGTTGRGAVIGNPNLKMESAHNIDLGLGWIGENMSLASHIFQLNVQDYIERVEVGEDLLTFVNLNNGRIIGLELSGDYTFNTQWGVDWQGHMIRGEDNNGKTLADIPSNRFSLGLNHHYSKWKTQLNIEFIAHKSKLGNSEKETTSSTLLSAAVHYQANPNWSIAFSANNLLNEKYFTSSDKKSALAPERSVALSFSWTMH
jgi:outer membrane receptor protein involved in Fe transport